MSSTAPSEGELIRIFREFGEETAGAAHCARHRRRPPIPAVRAHLAARRLDRTRRARSARRETSGHPRRKHPATRVFQALRIHVNHELAELKTALDVSLERLAPHGRLAVISFHSLEDRMVKQFMRSHSLTDPMYAGLPNVPAHARPKLKLVGDPSSRAARNSAQSARPQRAAARRRTRVRRRPRDPRKLLPLALPVCGLPC